MPKTNFRYFRNGQTDKRTDDPSLKESYFFQLERKRTSSWDNPVFCTWSTNKSLPYF